MRPLLLILTLSFALGLGCRTTQSPEGQVKDLRITAELKSKLASEVRLSTLTNINVNTTNGVVTLAGQVGSEEVKQKAEQVARSIPGVVAVTNNLQVAGEGQPAGRKAATEPPATD
jgi:osmotically-inducible protein OsmY